MVPHPGLFGSGHPTPKPRFFPLPPHPPQNGPRDGPPPTTGGQLGYVKFNQGKNPHTVLTDRPPQSPAKTTFSPQETQNNKTQVSKWSPHPHPNQPISPPCLHVCIFAWPSPPDLCGRRFPILSLGPHKPHHTCSIFFALCPALSFEFYPSNQIIFPVLAFYPSFFPSWLLVLISSLVVVGTTGFPPQSPRIFFPRSFWGPDKVLPPLIAVVPSSPMLFFEPPRAGPFSRVDQKPPPTHPHTKRTFVRAFSVDSAFFQPGVIFHRILATS